MTATARPSPAIPAERLSALFLRFLRFGALAWGGPVAQIAMIRQELVEEERWIGREEFNRVLAVYQVLPGPEAHELCVYFGMRAAGRMGGLLAGLGFLLPGFVLMFALSALYVGGIRSPSIQAFFLGLQPAVAALIVRAVHRIGSHALTDRRLWAIGLGAGAAHLLGANFWITLPLAGLLYLTVVKRDRMAAGAAALLLLAGVLLVSDLRLPPRETEAEPASPEDRIARVLPGPRPLPSTARLFASGLRSGLLTFGGAYTVLPYLQRDAVVSGGWMTNEEFLDGVALSGVLPAPFIIFSTFVGYLGGGPLGALVLTVAIFLPAFGFTLIGHQYLERLFGNASAKTFLDGVTAGVVGLIGATALALLGVAVHDLPTAALFGAALLGFYRWKAKEAVAFVMLAAGGCGLLLFRP